MFEDIFREVLIKLKEFVNIPMVVWVSHKNNLIEI